MSRILATAMCEFRIAFRNRWVTIATGMMVLFALVLSAAGSAPTGDVGVDRLSVTVASLTSLAVYLVPLLALLMSVEMVALAMGHVVGPAVYTKVDFRAPFVLAAIVFGVLALIYKMGYILPAELHDDHYPSPHSAATPGGRASTVEP